MGELHTWRVKTSNIMMPKLQGQTQQSQDKHRYFKVVLKGCLQL